MSWHSRKNPGIGRRSSYPLRRIHLEEGETVYDKGDPNDALYRVVEGTVHHSLPRRRKSSPPVERGADAIFGQAGLFSGSVRRDSAAAATDAVLDVMPREQVLKLLESHDENTRELLAALFDQAEPPKNRAPKDDCPDAVIDGILLVRLLLKPSSRPLAAWIGREPIEITRLPFVVGRLGEGDDASSNDHIDLVLNDKKPYQLSRQHFVIDTYDGELVIRDSGSYHGTTVNSQRIGNDRTTNMVSLHLGENSIIAGSTDSPYCFTLLIEAS